MGAYKLIKDITGRENLPLITKFLKKNELLNRNQVGALKRPGQSDKFLISIILNCMRENIGFITELNVKNDTIRDLIKLIDEETGLLLKFDSKQTVSDILSGSGIEPGTIRKITKLEANLNHPYIVETDNGVYFLRYTAPFGNRYIIRADPKEVIFQNLLCEYILTELVGGDFVTRTIYPSLKESNSRRKLDDSPEELKRLQERVIIQYSYTPEYGKLFERLELIKAGKIFGNLVGRIHRLTIGFNNSDNVLVKEFRSEIRDQTIDEYVQWLIKRNWVKKRFNAVNNLGSDITQYLDGIKTLEWDRCVQRSSGFWQNGAVLTHLDVRPNNTFYDKDKGVRIFDFDYLAFYDPSYHAAQTMFFAARDAVLKGETNSSTLTDMLINFMEGYFKQIQSKKLPSKKLPLFLESREYRENILDYFAFTTMSRCLSDYVCGITGLEQMKALYKTVNSFREGQIGKPNYVK